MNDILLDLMTQLAGPVEDATDRVGDEPATIIELIRRAIEEIDRLRGTEATWTHVKTYLALKERGEYVKPSNRSPYVQLYGQKDTCAILYHPEVPVLRDRPLHLNPKRKSWRQPIFDSVSPFIR
jgi:hypothetical protein